jgi:hypothetical protein
MEINYMEFIRPITVRKHNGDYRADILLLPLKLKIFKPRHQPGRYNGRLPQKLMRQSTVSPTSSSRYYSKHMST